MASDDNAIWTDGKRFITGSWNYIWHRDCFAISIDKRVSGLNIRNLDFSCSGETPEFGKWKLFTDKYCQVHNYKVCSKSIDYLVENKYKYRYWCCKTCITDDYIIIATYKELRRKLCASELTKKIH